MDAYRFSLTGNYDIVITVMLDIVPITSIKINGEQLVDLPQDLYIPPEALRVFLETFEGPLDLLLYLIRKESVNILDIPIADITRQYMQYIELMRGLQLELAAEYLLMAAMLAEIKSRLLLPKPAGASEVEEEDPRAELVRRLQEYERFQRAAEELDQLPRVDRDIFIADADCPPLERKPVKPAIGLPDILLAFQAVLERAQLFANHFVTPEVLSIRERMSSVLGRLDPQKFLEFTRFFRGREGAMGVVVTFIAVLELTRQSSIELVQAQPFAPIYLKRV
jgi:segregation and condensation protein A